MGRAAGRTGSVKTDATQASLPSHLTVLDPFIRVTIDTIAV